MLSKLAERGDVGGLQFVLDFPPDEVYGVWQALAFAMVHHQWEAARALAQRTDVDQGDGEILVRIALSGCVTSVRFLVQQLRADVHAGGERALFEALAAPRGDVAMVEELLRLGADARACAEAVSTGLHDGGKDAATDGGGWRPRMLGALEKLAVMGANQAVAAVAAVAKPQEDTSIPIRCYSWCFACDD